MDIIIIVDDQNITSLLDELSSFDFTSTANQITKNQSSEINITDETAKQYFFDKTKALIDAGVGAVQTMTPYVVQGQDSREIDALSKLMAATAQALDTLNKGALIDKKAERDEELEHIKLQGKKELMQLKQQEQSAKTQNNLNIVVSSPEEIMKKLFPNTGNILNIENK
jgi:hypothetical protein